MKYYHCDVFSKEAMSGNGLTVLFTDKDRETSQLQEIAKEFKQFETVFIWPKEEEAYPIRIFTVEEELDFAGHPMLGASAAVLLRDGKSNGEIKLKINGRIVNTEAQKKNGYFSVKMNQGVPLFLGEYKKDEIRKTISALNLTPEDLSDTLPIEVVSTGLNYLLVPVKDETALSRSNITGSGFEDLLMAVNAKFVYVFYFDKDTGTPECRTWDNFGNVEDVATGSAAGPLGAYLVKNQCIKKGEKVSVHQGRFVGRPSIINVWQEETNSDMIIEGDVTFLVEQGELKI